MPCFLEVTAIHEGDKFLSYTKDRIIAIWTDSLSALHAPLKNCIEIRQYTIAIKHTTNLLPTTMFAWYGSLPTQAIGDWGNEKAVTHAKADTPCGILLPSNIVYKKERKCGHKSTKRAKTAKVDKRCKQQKQKPKSKHICIELWHMVDKMMKTKAERTVNPTSTGCIPFKKAMWAVIPVRKIFLRKIFLQGWCNSFAHQTSF